MYFDIFVNDELVAVVGPHDLEHLLISIASHDGETSISAHGLTAELPGKAYLSWLQRNLESSDIVRIAPSSATEASIPRQTRSLRRGEIASKEDKFCDFCKRAEDEAGRVIQTGDTPFICRDCAELCTEVFKGWEEEAAKE